jgi:YgiT-type zinc finger domain-containing protein
VTCVSCKSGEPAPGTTTVTVTKDGTIVIVSGAPAEICSQCGERYYDQATTERLLAMVKEAVRPGIKLELREYIAA